MRYEIGREKRIWDKIGGIVIFGCLSLIPIILNKDTFNTSIFIGVLTTAIIVVLWTAPILSILAYGYYSTPNKLIIEGDIFIAERIFFEDYKIPIKNITQIEKEFVISRSSGYVYTIRYRNKSLRLNPNNYGFGGKGFDKFILELKLKVDGNNCIGDYDR